MPFDLATPNGHWRFLTLGRRSCICNNMSDTDNSPSDYDAAVSRISEQCIAVRMRMLNRVITAVYDDAVRPLGLTAGQSNILVMVERLGNPRQGDVGKLLYMEKSTLSRNVERLRQNGWLEVTEHAGDRARYLNATPSGRDVIEQSLPLWESAQIRAREIIGPAGEQGLRDAADALWRAGAPT